MVLNPRVNPGSKFMLSTGEQSLHVQWDQGVNGQQP